MEGRAIGRILHATARTTTAVRRAIQHNQASLIALSKRHGVNPKTVAKWKKRTSVGDLPTGLPTGPKDQHTLLPLFDNRHALQATHPHLTRLSLHRCLQRHGISRLPEVTGDKAPSQQFQTYLLRTPRLNPWSAAALVRPAPANAAVS